jgi:hypothetical protein
MKQLGIFRFLAIAALALVGFGAVSSDAHAGAGAWSNYTSGPTIYQTNFWYYSSYANPPGGIPSTAQVNSFGWTLNLSYYPSGTQAAIMNSSNAGFWLPSISGSQSINGGSANQAFKFGFYINQSTTHQLSPTVYGGGHQIIVNYVY